MRAVEKGETAKPITVLTPTYNRRRELEKLYQSLCAQTDTNVFDWLIVDDGSGDDTGEAVQAWAGEAPFPVRYLRKENGGKHTALNLGIAEISAPLTFIVDSDDSLTPDAAGTILRYYAKYQSRLESEHIGGFCFLRADSAGEVNAGRFPQDEFLADYCSSRINAGIEGDRAEVFLTEVLRQFPFREFPGEKYLPEDAVWMAMSGIYTLVNVNHVIYICDYLQGGLTKTGRKMKIHSPFGMMYRSAVYLNDPRVNPKTRCKMMLLYRIYDHFAAEREENGHLTAEETERCRSAVQVRRTALYHLMALPAAVLYRRWRKEYQAG